VFHVFFSPPNIDGLTAGFISVRVRGLTSDCGVDPAQQSIRAALLKDAGLLSLDPVVQSSGGLPASARAAAMRFASLPPATRHAWLQTHLAALAAGRLTSAQIP
jgi:hypothetical protein